MKRTLVTLSHVSVKFHKGNEIFLNRGNEAQAGEKESVEEKNQLLHRKTVKMLMMMMMVKMLMMTMIVVTLMMMIIILVTLMMMTG